MFSITSASKTNRCIIEMVGVGKVGFIFKMHFGVKVFFCFPTAVNTTHRRALVPVGQLVTVGLATCPPNSNGSKSAAKMLWNREPTRTRQPEHAKLPAQLIHYHRGTSKALLGHMCVRSKSQIITIVGRRGSGALPVSDLLCIRRHLRENW